MNAGLLLSYLFAAGAAMSIVTAFLFTFDKLMALKGRRRVPEGYLMLASLMMGAFGALFAMTLFNHKVRRPLFYLGVPMFLFAQIGLAVYLKTVC